MKILHTGDWHIGKIVNQRSMLADQEYILEALLALAAEERPDAVLISGDIYDRSIPPAEAVELLDRVLSRLLLELSIPVLAIAGNHDSPDRLGFGSSILRAKGLHIAGRFTREIRRVVLQDEHGPVNFYLVPYAPPLVVREVLGCEAVCDHDTAMAAVTKQIKEQFVPGERQVILAHGFIRGIAELEHSESEKPLGCTLAVGGTEYVDVQHFKGFHYTALGHLHGPQTAGQPQVRYAGSLLKYSFSECSQKKSVTLVTLDQAGEAVIEQRVLQPRRDMRRLQGNIHELLAPEFYATQATEDYLHVVLTDEGEILEPMSKLRSVYPNVLSLETELRRSRGTDSKTAAGEGYRQKTMLELFGDFYQDITEQEFSEEKRQLAAQVIMAVQGEEGK